MAVLERISRVRLRETAQSHFRQFEISVSSLDVSPGTPITITFIHTTGGALAPGEPDGTRTIDVRVDNSATTVEGFTWSPPQAPGTYTNTFTPTRAGILRLYGRFARTTVSAYDVNTDGTAQTLPAGVVTTNDQGWFRANTSVAVSASNVAAGGAKTLPFAFGDALHSRVTLGHEPYSGGVPLRLSIGASPAITDDFAPSSATTDRTHGTVDNRFTASRAVRAWAITVRNPTLATNQAAMVPTSTTNDSADLDPRLTATRLFQLNDNAYGTPPLAKNNATNQRLTSDLAFISTRFINARGGGVNSLNVTGTLRDEKQLVGAVSRTTDTGTNGGEAGWMNSFLVWDSQIPGGTWTKTNTVNTANATGLLANATQTYQLLATNPAITLITAGGPLSAEKAKHFSAGMAFQMGLAAINTLGQSLLAVDTATAALVRLQDAGANTGRSEYLDSDMVWKRITTADTVYFWPLSETIAGASRVYIRTFAAADTASWGEYDLFVVGKAVIAGTPYGTQAKEIGVGAANDHAGYSIDPLALAASGILSAR